MDRRKYQRVVLFVGLLFLICIAEIFWGYRAVRAVRMSEQEILGNMVSQHPELEAELTQSFYGKNTDGTAMTDEQREEAHKAGLRITEKYGYSTDDSIWMRPAKKDVAIGIFVLVLGGIGIMILLWQERKQSVKFENESERLQQEKEETELHFQKVKQMLEAEEQSTKCLITDIAHQLKTPIASLKMGYEIEETTELTEEEKADFHRKGFEEMKKLETLLDSLMKLSKLEVKLIQIEPVHCSMREILTQAVNAVFMKAYEKQIEIVTEEFVDEMMYLDQKWTGEAIVNILDNAVKYSPEQSAIYIRVEKMTTYLLVEIADEGIGIVPEEVHRIFQRFYRGNREEIKSQEGSGVGLYLARKIVEIQGGTISVKSDNLQNKSGRKGQSCIEKETCMQERTAGSIFRITLPI